MEPGVFEGLFGCDAFLGVVNEDFSEQVEESLVKVAIAMVRRNDILKLSV